MSIYRVLILFFFSSLTFAEEFTEEQRITMDAGKIQQFYISNINGTISLHPSTNDKIQLTITKKISIDKNMIAEDPQDILKQIFISTEKSQDTIKLITR